MGNTFRKYITCCKKNETISLLLLGLNNSGKTEVAHQLCNIQRREYQPTKGCCIYETNVLNSNVKLLEIGGSEEIRKIWKHYFLEIMGVVFVVNSNASIHEMNISKDILSNLISHKLLVGKPFLIIATNQDQQNAIDMMELCDFLDVEYLANRYKTPCLLEFTGLWDDTPTFVNEITSAFHWILQTIMNNYKIIKNRIKFNRITNDLDVNLPKAKRTRSSTSNIHRKRNKLQGRPRTAPTIKTTNYNFLLRDQYPVKIEVPQIEESTEDIESRMINQFATDENSNTQIDLVPAKIEDYSTLDLQFVCREKAHLNNIPPGTEVSVRSSTLIIDDLSNDESNKENQLE